MQHKDCILPDILHLKLFVLHFIFTPRNRIYHFMQNDLFRCGLNISNLHMQMINYCARVSLLTCWQKCAQILHLKAKVILALLCFCFRWYLLFRIAFEIEIELWWVILVGDTSFFFVSTFVSLFCAQYNFQNLFFKLVLFYFLDFLPQELYFCFIFNIRVPWYSCLWSIMLSVTEIKMTQTKIYSTKKITYYNRYR